MAAFFEINFFRKKFGIPLELYMMEMILKPKMDIMKRTTITTVESKVSLAETLIEDHINNMHHADKPFGKNEKIDSNTSWENFENLNWCCEHSPAEGTIEITYAIAPGTDRKRVIVPITTNFGVICTKEKESNYKIKWSYSLS
jgi:hypothetical protein